MSAPLIAVSVDCANAGKLAGFWAEVMGRPVDPDPSEGFAAIGLACRRRRRPGLDVPSGP